MYKILCFIYIFSFTKGFLTDGSNKPSNDVLRDVLDLMVDEKNLRHQLEEAVTQLKHELDEVKQNQTVYENELKEIRQENSDLKVALQNLNHQTLNGGTTSAPSPSTNNCQCSSTDAPRIGFTVSLHSAVYSMSSLHFNYTIYSSDNDIKNSLKNGIFTCTRPGLYMFSLSIVSKKASSQGAWVELLKNNHIVAYASTGPSADDRGSTTVVLHLFVSDRISVRSQSSSYSYRSETYFSGALLAAD